MQKFLLIILGILLMGILSQIVSLSHFNADQADAQDGSSGVGVWCSDQGIQYRVGTAITGTLSLSGATRAGPGTTCNASAFSTTNGADGETSLSPSACTRSGNNLIGYVKGFKIGAGGLGCTTQNNVTSKVYGAASGQEILLDLQATATNYSGTNRFDNISSVGNALVIYGDGGKVGTTPVGDGGPLDGQTDVATDGFVVTGGDASAWYLGFQFLMSSSSKNSQINVTLTAS